MTEFLISFKYLFLLATCFLRPITESECPCFQSESDDNGYSECIKSVSCSNSTSHNDFCEENGDYGNTNHAISNCAGPDHMVFRCNKGMKMQLRQ